MDISTLAGKIQLCYSTTELAQVETDLTMTSREIAALTGKEHFHVLRDIRTMLTEIGVGLEKAESYYIDSMNRKKPEIVISAKLAELVLAKYIGLARMPLSTKENAALDTIEQLLNVKLHRQFRVGSYRIDGYDEQNNIAYEIDEESHRSKLKQDLARQKEIEVRLKCKFVRIKV